MIEFIVRRLLVALPVLLLVSLIAASIMQLVPGDPATLIAGQNASDIEIANVREQLGLNRPFIARLADWYVALARGATWAIRSCSTAPSRRRSRSGSP